MKITKLLAIALPVLIPLTAEAKGLKGSPASMEHQHEVAVEGDLTFVDGAAELRKLVENGSLDSLHGNEDYLLSRVSFPYALPEVKLFIERLAAQYRAANGAQLIVTSLTRPSSLQPRNAHQLSVHPTGMAVDFRVPGKAAGRAWLESALLQLENGGVLDVTRERYPPHYHVAVFPEAYGAYAAPLIAAEAKKKNAEAVEPAVHTEQVATPVAAPAAAERNPEVNHTLAVTVVFALSVGLVMAPAAAVSRKRALR